MLVKRSWFCYRGGRIDERAGTTVGSGCKNELNASGAKDSAWFNSCCYHSPRAHPQEFAIFSSIDVLLPTPGACRKRQFPTPGTLDID